jgi:hypothetical protein
MISFASSREFASIIRFLTPRPKSWARVMRESGIEKQNSIGFKPTDLSATPKVICLITWPLPDSKLASHTNNMVDDCCVTAAREEF